MSFLFKKDITSCEKLNNEDQNALAAANAERYISEAQKHRDALKQSWKMLGMTGLFTVTAVICLTIMTMAWFASNKNVNSSGMKIQTEVTPNLIISKLDDASATGIRNPNLTGSMFEVVFEDAASVLTPATHDWANGTATGLTTNENPSLVSASTGYGRDGELTLTPVPVYSAGQKMYYKDYVVYIASIGSELPVTELNATISSPNDSLEDYQMASSVDFYIGEVSSANYKGTLNLAGKNYSTGAELTSINLVSGLGKDANNNYVVPLNTESSIKVTMRFYFDGALEKSTNLAYVRSEGLTTSDFSMGIHFEAVAVTGD